MGGLLDIKVTTKKNGQEVAWFRDFLGRRVGTSMRLRGNQTAITNAQQMQLLGDYYIRLQQEQLDAGVGSNGAPMPPLKSARRKRWSIKKQEWVEYGLSSPEHGYSGEKKRAGLAPKRDLYFTGEMRSDIRVNYVDDQMAKISITTQKSRQKALANERKAPWWGLSPANSRLFAEMQATLYGGAVEDWLDSLGLVQAGDYMVRLAKRLNMNRMLAVLNRARNLKGPSKVTLKRMRNYMGQFKGAA